MIENYCWAEFRRADLESHILQRNAAGVPGVEAICRHWPKREVLARKLRKVAPGSVFGSTATPERQVDIIEGNILQRRSADAIQRDTGVAFARVVAAR